MASKPLTTLIWVAVCVAVSSLHSDAKPEFNNDGLSETSDGFRKSDKGAYELVRNFLEDENINSDGKSDMEDERNNFNARFRNGLGSPETNKQKFKKRTCRFNLGGHCATENAVKMADEWNFLKSPLSPGRRRRRSSASSASNSANHDQLGSRRDHILTHLDQRP